MEKESLRILEVTDAVIMVTLESICLSNLHILHGAVPIAEPRITMGHEFVGVVEAVGEDVKNVKPN